MTSELKEALLLNDFRMLNATMQSRRITIKNREAKCNNALLKFKSELDKVTAEIEDALYASPYDGTIGE